MSKIQDKVDKLNKVGFDLGTAIDKSDQSAGSGGQYRRFQNASIYWHPFMGDEAHEVHGGILTKYLELGGAGTNPHTGKRELGFPLSDEINTLVAGYPVSYFEWGAIIWKDGGLVISGEFYKFWKAAAAEAGHLGYPIHADVVAAASGQALFFEYGCLWKGTYSKDIKQILFGFPKIGNPAFIATNKLSVLKQEVYVQFALGSAPPPKIDFPRTFFEDLFGGRLFLVPTGQSEAKPLPLVFEAEDTKIVQTLGVTYFRGQAVVKPSELSKNTLYDVSIKLSSGKLVSLAPHAIYVKNSWTDFGIMHATDIHASLRLDGFRAKLKKLGREEGAKAFNNYNDNFRDLIRYANKLHDAGKLDLMIITGDLVDYEFEELVFKSEDNNERLTSPSTSGDNFAFFEALIRGQVPSPDGKSNEELRVPIITTLGNHDYRAYQYLLNFEVNLEVTSKKIPNYVPHNLTNEEANDLQGGFKSYSKETSANMVKVDDKLEYYFKRFSDNSSFMVRLGKHQILMLDTRWDKDMLDDWLDAIYHYFGTDSESSRNFVDGNPDSLGMNDSQIALLRNVLNEPQGLVFIGMHAPPVNPKGNEYPHYFRETEHPYLKLAFDFDTGINNDISAYLLRNDLDTLIPDARPDKNGGWYKSHKGWSQTEGAGYFYKGKNGGDLLDYGIGKDKIEEFLQLCAGVGVARKANLVLCGHNHRRTEFRLEWNDKKEELLFYFDFYTENPSQYYPSKKLAFDKPVQIEVKEGAPVPDQDNPVLISRKSLWGTDQVLRVPPYKDTLNKTVNKIQWWKKHSPLILQTAAVGPTEANQRLQKIIGENRNNPGPSFQGCRIITVENDLISNITYVDLPTLKRKPFGLFVSTDGKGNIATLKQHTNWRDGDLIVSGNFGNNEYTDLLFYKHKLLTVEGLFVSTDGNGNISTLKQHTNWDKDWDLIIPGNFGGNEYTNLLFYKQSTGEALFVSTDGKGNIPILKQHTNWDKDWDLIIPGNFGGNEYTDLLFYKQSSGEALFVSTDGNGNISTLKQHTNWDKDWDLIIPGNFGGNEYTDLLFYKRSSGEALFVSTDGKGNISPLKQHTNWDKDWDLIIPVNFGGNSYTDLLFYKRSTGEGLFVATDGSGNISALKQHTTWDKDWDLIIAGNFGGNSYTDLLFYK